VNRRLPPAGSEGGSSSPIHSARPHRKPEPGEAMREAFRAAGLKSERFHPVAPDAPVESTTTKRSQTAGGNRTLSCPQPSPSGQSTKAEQAHHPVRPGASGKGDAGKPKNGGRQGRKDPASRHQPQFRHYPSGAKVSPRPKASPATIRPEVSVPRPTQAPVGTKPEPPKHPTRAEIWDGLERRLAGLATAAEAGSRATAAASGSPSQADTELLLERLRAGVAAHNSGTGSKQSRMIEIVLGIDFGTTSTKIVARLPYEPGAPAFAVPAIPFAQSERHAYLWASRLWLAPDGTFSLAPVPRGALVCAIKANLMVSGSKDPAVLDAGGGMAASAEEAATAFLALQIRQAKGWLATEKAFLLRKGEPRWSYNFGFPAASLDNGILRGRYERAAAAAVALAEGPSEIELPVVRSALAAAVGDTNRWLERHRIGLHPEIAAAVAGFANSTRREDGLYALVDVGGGTVDCCTFNLFTAGDGVARCPIFTAHVEMLGVEPWRLCERDEFAAKAFRYLLDTLQRTVIWDTKVRRDPLSERWRTGLPLFFVGGGISSRTHQASTAKLPGWLRQNTCREGGVRVETLPAPEGLEHPYCPADQVHRLGVAIGLSLPVTDIPEVEFPGRIRDYQPVPTASRTDIYVGKDQV
jgi:hypothetical protein